MHQFVPLEPFLEIKLLLTHDQQPAKQVDIRVADVLIREGTRLRQPRSRESQRKE